MRVNLGDLICIIGNHDTLQSWASFMVLWTGILRL